jgi:hypothetical protein
MSPGRVAGKMILDNLGNANEMGTLEKRNKIDRVRKG